MSELTLPTQGEMTHEHRVTIGSLKHGLYLLGMATTDFERTDERCAMDNSRVPHRYEQLSDEDRQLILKIHAPRTV